MKPPRQVVDEVYLPAEVASMVTRFSPAEVYAVAGVGRPRCEPPLVRSRWRGGRLFVHAGDLFDVAATCTPIVVGLVDLGDIV